MRNSKKEDVPVVDSENEEEEEAEDSGEDWKPEVCKTFHCSTGLISLRFD